MGRYSSIHRCIEFDQPRVQPPRFDAFLSVLAPIMTLQNVFYSTFVMASAAVYTLASRRPPPPEGSRASVDSVMSNFIVVTVAPWAPFLALAPALGIAVLALSYPDLPPAQLCSRPENLNPTLLTFNPVSIAVLICTFSGGLLRLVAMAQLGSSFTWELAKPLGGLKRDGLFRYMQHPSYTGAFLASIAFLPFFWRFDGPLGCWVPSLVARSRLMNSAPVLLIAYALFWSLSKRIPNEEAMLKKEFGKEWEMYHRTTKRFVPGII